MKIPNPINFVKRYWVLLVLWLAASVVAKFNIAFLYLGLIIYIPFLTLSAFLVGLLIRNVFNSETSDHDSDSGQFTREWKALPPEKRVTLSVYQLLVYFMGACLIAAAVASRQ